MPAGSESEKQWKKMGKESRKNPIAVAEMISRDLWLCNAGWARFGPAFRYHDKSRKNLTQNPGQWRHSLTSHNKSDGNNPEWVTERLLLALLKPRVGFGLEVGRYFRARAGAGEPAAAASRWQLSATQGLPSPLCGSMWHQARSLV